MTGLTVALVFNVSLLSAIPQSSQTYETAYRQSAETGKPLLVYVGADWCPGCQAMKQSVLPQLRRQGGLADVQFAAVNTDRQSQLAGKLMHGSTIPQLILFRQTPDGWKRAQLTGAQSVADVERFVRRGVARRRVAGKPTASAQ